MTEQELCWRCPTPMAWVHGTWQCPRCKFKLGCCEGDPQTPCDVQGGELQSGTDQRGATPSTART